MWPISWLQMGSYAFLRCLRVFRTLLWQCLTFLKRVQEFGCSDFLGRSSDFLGRSQKNPRWFNRTQTKVRQALLVATQPSVFVEGLRRVLLGQVLRGGVERPLWATLLEFFSFAQQLQTEFLCSAAITSTEVDRSPKFHCCLSFPVCGCGYGNSSNTSSVHSLD